MDKIKYHQYGVDDNEYGSDHVLTNNWDPDLDYGKEYVKVYFNIETPTYSYNHGFSKTDRDNWNAEASQLISSLGILEDCGYAVENSENKCAYLYAHPQQFSGVILKNDVKRVAEAISNMKLSSLRWVDLYETVYKISDEEYEKYLTQYDEDIKKDLLQNCRTSRTTKYFYAFEVCRKIADTYRMNRLGHNDGKNYGSGQTIEHIMNILKDMGQKGLLVVVENRNGKLLVRSLNKTEQKKQRVAC